MTPIPPGELEAVFGSAADAETVESLRQRPFGSTAGVWRVRVGGGSAVLKLLRLGAAPTPRWLSQPEPQDPYYWRREPLVYESGVLEGLGDLRAPALLGLHERPDGSLALWLEDVPAAPPWSPERLGSFARRLGRAQALLAADPPAAEWLARDWLHAYLLLHEVDDPERDEVLARLGALPHAVSHNDLHPANVLGDDASVVVDWAYCGLAPLGLDAGVLVADGVADLAIPAAEADDAADAVWAGYAGGLREGGFEGPLEEIRWAFLRGTALRLSWLRPSLPRVREEWMREPWTAAIALLDRWRDEARELA